MPGAYTVSMGWGLLRCSIASASRRYNSYIFQPFIGGLSISKAPLQASTSSSWARSGKVSRMPNRSSFQGPRLIFTLPARHCELNGPNLVSLSPLSRAEIHAEAAERAYEVKGPVLAGLWSATIPICVGDK